jgi:hypothetical protein
VVSRSATNRINRDYAHAPASFGIVLAANRSMSTADSRRFEQKGAKSLND